MRRQELAHHEYPFLLFLPVLHILRRLVTRLNMRRNEVNRWCQIVLGCVVLAFSNIPGEVCQDELTDIELQTTALSQSRASTSLSKCGNHQSISTDLSQSRCVGSRCAQLIGVSTEERKRRGFDNHVEQVSDQAPKHGQAWLFALSIPLFHVRGRDTAGHGP